MVLRTNDRAARLEALGLKFGMTVVVRYQGKLYGHGDLKHCPREDIEHNMRALVKILRKENLARVSKDFDAGLYRDKTLKQDDWGDEMWGALMIYENKVFALDEDGSITGTISAERVEDWAARTGRSTKKAERVPNPPPVQRRAPGSRKGKTPEPGVSTPSMF
ncbi:MAG: hypothetical protein U1B30_15880 [Pseudomonadota bacterium]|nr:hypothetical protein [Pseudomonadota bacterium]